MRYRGVQRHAIGLVLFLIIFCPGQVLALDVTLQWDANTEPDLAGYQVLYAEETCCPDGSASCDNPDPDCLYEGTGSSSGDSPIEMPLDQDENPDDDNVEYTVKGLPDDWS